MLTTSTRNRILLDRLDNEHEVDSLIAVGALSARLDAIRIACYGKEC